MQFLARTPIRLFTPATGALAVAASLLLAPQANAALPALKRVGTEGLAPPAVRVQDTVLTPRFERTAAPQSGSSAAYAAPTGARVSVDVQGYRRDDASVQDLVDFVDSLVHGPELDRLSISIRTPEELQRICGVGSDACYAPALMRMIVPGEDRPQASLEQLVAHEYGHHVLANQRNDPWDASRWGAKRWATHENVCALTEHGEAFPGDERAHYRLNPAEAFAESFRVVNASRAGTWGASPFIVDPLFYPDATAARLLEQDVLHPLNRPTLVRRSAVLRTGQVRRWSVTTPWDGTVRASASGAHVRLLDAAGHALGGWTRNADTLVCGTRSLTVAVRASQAGRSAVTIARP
jgi:hypothetical protein